MQLAASRALIQRPRPQPAAAVGQTFVAVWAGVAGIDWFASLCPRGCQFFHSDGFFVACALPNPTPRSLPSHPITTKVRADSGSWATLVACFFCCDAFHRLDCHKTKRQPRGHLAKLNTSNRIPVTRHLGCLTSRCCCSSPRGFLPHGIGDFG
jgi:hypothetical protein